MMGSLPQRHRGHRGLPHRASSDAVFTTKARSSRRIPSASELLNPELLVGYQHTGEVHEKENKDFVEPMLVGVLLTTAVLRDLGVLRAFVVKAAPELRPRRSPLWPLCLCGG
jgi:hypothetical protein